MEIYLLAGSSDAEAVSGAATVQVQRVIMPDYLDTTDIVLRYGPHQMKSSTTGEWGQRLSAGIAQALRTDLAAFLPRDVVTLGPPIDGTARQVSVTVDALDMWPDGECSLTVHWTAGGRKGHGVFSAPANAKPDDETRVAGLAASIQQLAGRIASERFGA
jgi:uncharacterized lipoprotein YmbA